MTQQPAEWLKQADYDMETADFMFSGGRYFYAVFISHISIEKALKALYLEKTEEIPPKTHNLVYLINRVAIKPPENIIRFIVKLNEASVATRYPEELETLQKEYTESIVNDILSKSRETLEWIKTQF